MTYVQKLLGCLYYVYIIFSAILAKITTKPHFHLPQDKKISWLLEEKDIFWGFFNQPKQNGKKCNTATLLRDVRWQGYSDILQPSVKSPSAQHTHTRDFWLFVRELCPRAGLWVVMLFYLIVLSVFEESWKSQIPIILPLCHIQWDKASFNKNHFTFLFSVKNPVCFWML